MTNKEVSLKIFESLDRQGDWNINLKVQFLKTEIIEEMYKEDNEDRRTVKEWYDIFYEKLYNKGYSFYRLPEVEEYKQKQANKTKAI